MAERMRFRPIPCDTDAIEESDSLRCMDWKVSEGNTSKWSYERDLEFGRQIQIDCVNFLKASGLPFGTKVRVFSEWSSSLSPRLRGRGQFSEFKLGLDGLEVDIPQRLRVPGVKAGGEITLKSRVVVIEVPEGGVLPGTSIWEDEQRFLLERDEVKIPITSLSFSNHRAHVLNKNARWFVRIEENPYDMHISSAIQVFLNRDYPDFVELLGDESDSDHSGDQVRRFLKFEIGREMVSRALRDPEFLERDSDDFKEGTYGMSLRMRLKSLSSRHSIDDLAKLLQTDPADFDAMLQAQFFEV